VTPVKLHHAMRSLWNWKVALLHNVTLLKCTLRPEVSHTVSQTVYRSCKSVLIIDWYKLNGDCTTIIWNPESRPHLAEGSHYMLINKLSNGEILVLCKELLWWHSCVSVSQFSVVVSRLSLHNKESQNFTITTERLFCVLELADF